MGRIKPMLLMGFNSPTLSGGNRRVFEILRRAKSEGIDYVIVTDRQSCYNASRMLPDSLRLLSHFRTYVASFDWSSQKLSRIPGLDQLLAYRDILVLSLSASKIALRENVDLIVGFEDNKTLLTSYLTGKLSGKPWTAVFQASKPLFQPSSSIGSLNPLNILKFVGQEDSAKNLPFLSKIGLSTQVLEVLRVAENSLMLSVSGTVVEELKHLNPKIRFHVIEPANGIDLEEFATNSDTKQEYDALFFARLVPEKGLYELPAIWKNVTEEIPEALLGVAGITEDQRYVNQFLEMISKLRLSRNIVFLGEYRQNALMNLIRSSRLTLNPTHYDSFSLVTLESLACGTPVVAYDIAAIRHNFGKCDAVIRCPVKDRKSMAQKAISIIQDENLRAMLSEKATEYSANYDWNDVVRAEKEAYYKVIARSKKGR